MRTRQRPITAYPNIPEREVSGAEQPRLADQELKNLRQDLRDMWADLANYLEDTTHRIDNYRVQTLGADANTAVTLQPEYEVPEIITSVIVTGPPAAPAFILKLGKRVWNLVLPVSQILVIAPVQFSLGRNDDRFLTSAVSGDWGLELMGYANFTESYRTLE